MYLYKCLVLHYHGFAKLLGCTSEFSRSFFQRSVVVTRRDPLPREDRKRKRRRIRKQLGLRVGLSLRLTCVISIETEWIGVTVVYADLKDRSGPGNLYTGTSEGTKKLQQHSYVKKQT